MQKKNLRIVTIAIIITSLVNCGRAYGWQKSNTDAGKRQTLKELKTSQEILDSYRDYLFDKNYVLHFPSGKTSSFEKGVNGINNSQEGKFSPDGKYLAYTYGNVRALGSRGNDLIIYDIKNMKSNKIQGSHRLIKNINWFTYRDKLYLLYNAFSNGEYDDAYFFIVRVENVKEVVSRIGWSFVDFLSEGDGIRYDIGKPGNKVVGHYVAKFEDLLLFDVLMIPSKEAKQIIAKRANDVVLTFKNTDMKKLSHFIHPDKGVRFSPYSYVDLENDLVFTAIQIRNIFADTTKYIWGVYDATGYPIELTFVEYFKQFIYDQDFAKAKEIGYNRIIGKGNTINNNFEVYPGTIIVEFHFPGFDPKYQGIDWKSLRLVFEEKDGIWYLVGIIHDQWTI